QKLPVWGPRRVRLPALIREQFAGSPAFCRDQINLVLARGRTIYKSYLLSVRGPSRRCRSDGRTGDGTAEASVPLGPPKNGVRNCDIGNPLAIRGISGVISAAAGKDGCELARSALITH